MSRSDCKKSGNQMKQKMISSVFMTLLLLLFVVVEGHQLPSNKTSLIRTHHGDVYECIDANKQPSLLHPALKNHKVKGLSLGKKRNETSRSVGIGLDEGCPTGHVPIRTQLAEISPNVSSAYSFKAEFAGLVTKQTVPRLHPIIGSFAVFTVYNPDVEPNQRSSAVIALESVVFGRFSRVEAGWMVNPGLFGDDQTRLYVGWVEADDSTTRGCYNTVCQGFIVTSNTFPLGSVFPDVSSPRGRKFDATFDIHLLDGRWKLTVNGEEVGYWPSEIVPHLDPNTLRVRWGGEILKPDRNDNFLPEMGDGKMYKKWQYSFNAYVRQIVIRHNETLVLTPQNDEVELFWANCYRVLLNQFNPEKDLGYSFIYGGKYGEFGRRC